nr:putative reverse transcriptase, RNA-dependent DNA polymerase [Tanacetum cinerariifolium]
MNYVPVDAGTNSTNLSGTKNAARQEVKRDVSSLRYIALPNWVHDALLESSSSKPQDDCSTDVLESSGNSNPTATSINPPADQLETLTVETPIPTIFLESQQIQLIQMKWKLMNKSKEVGEQSFIATIHQKIDPSLLQFCLFSCFLSQVEPKKIFDALQDPSWVEAIQEELLQFKIQNVWTLADCPKGASSSRAHTQEEGIDYDEVFTPVARIEAIRLFLAYASFMGFTVYQMDVKSAFLYGTINEEVYVMQPPGFLDPEFPAKHQVTPKECHLHAVKRIFRYLKVHPKLGLWYPKESPFDLIAYSDSDYGGATQDRKSTTGGCQFLSRRLISWQCKKQTIMATLTTEAKYVAAASCCGQVLWIQNQLLDYGNKIMARLQFYAYHNMVAILEKSEHNVDFHPIVDFVEASPLSYALTFKPTVYVSHIRQFWSTARIKTTKEGTKILATVDGILRTVTESSLRRNLKLQDEEGISSLPDTELFENLTLMGYNIYPYQKFTFQKGQFSHQWKYLIHTIMQYISPKSTGFNEFSSNIATALGEGSGTPTEPHHTPSSEAQQTSSTTPSSPTLPSVTTAPIPTVTPSDTHTLRQYTRKARIAQSSALPPVADEPASPLRDVCQAPRVTSPVAAEGTHEMEIHRLKARVKLLEDREGMVGDRSRDYASIKGRNLDEGEAAAERVSDDTEEMATVLTSMDAATVLAIPTVGPIFSTATVVTPYTRRKGKETMVESETPKKNEVARDAEIARIHAEEELQSMIDGLDRSNETVAKYLQEYHQFASELPLERRIELISDLVRYQDNYAKVHKYQSQQKKPWSKKQKRDYYMAVIRSNLVWKQIKKFIPMGSKEEAERFKKKGIRFEQESMKKLKTSEEVPEEVKSPNEVPEEKITRLGGSSSSYQFFIDMLKHLDREDLNQLWALVKESLSNRPPTSDKGMELWVELKRLYEPDDEDQLWTHTQNLMHAPVEWKLYDTCRVHHVTAKDKEIFMLVEKDYPLRKGLAIGMIRYKLQVKNYSKMENDLILKIYKIASSPRQQGD